MDVTATTKYVRLSASKARDVASALRGKPVEAALATAQLSARKAGKYFYKTLKSAIANATHNSELNADDLRVKSAVVHEGPALRRFWPRARGSAGPISKRMCHITVVLTDGKSEAAEPEGA
jgi:large subunit ribosomal protein L22